MAPDIDGVLNQADQGRRDFLRRVIAGAAFAPPLLASFSLDGLSLTTADAQVCNQTVGNQTVVGNQTETCFDFSGNEYDDNFTGVLRANDINPGLDLGGTGHSALNFTGSAGAAGGTWATVLDCDGFLQGRLSADILIHPFNNSKGVGLLTLAFSQVGDKGLALLVTDAGSTDKLQLVTVDTAGTVGVLKTVSLGSGITENAWYRLILEVGLPGLCAPVGNVLTCPATVTGQVFRHTTPSDPDSPVGAQVGPTLTFDDDITVPLRVPSRVGIIARAVSAVVSSSVTNFCVGDFGPKV
jgi:hypothetical protein